MRKFRVSYPNVEGYFLYGYDEKDDTLCYFERVNRAILDFGRFKEYLPECARHVENLRKNGFNVEEIIEVSFENFWNLYDDKRDKTKTKAIWDRLSENRRKQYFDWVKPYFKFLQEKHQGTDWTQFKKMAKSYLSKENAPWEDEAIRKYAKKEGR
jgi:hypothetical protein